MPDVEYAHFMNLTFLKWRQKLTGGLAVLLCGLAFVIDCYPPLNVAGLALYPPVILFASFARSRSLLIFVALMSSIFLIFSRFFPVPEEPTARIIINTILGVTVQWILVFMCEVLIDKEHKSKLLAKIVEYCPDAILTKDREGVVTSWNQGARALYGYTASEMLGRNIEIVFPDDRKDELKFILDKVINKGESIQNMETKRRRKDGTIVDVELSFSPIISPNGEISGAAAVGRDITELKRVQKELSQLNEDLKRQTVKNTVELADMKSNLRKSGEYFQNLIENSLALITVIDLEGIIVFQNHSSQRCLGYTPEEMLGRSYLDFLHPRHVTAFLQAISTASREWDRNPMVEISVRHKDGSWHDLEAIVLDMKKNQQISGLVINARDVTERKVLTQEILRIGEEEQLRMAQELHDGVTQQLAGINFMIKTLQDKLEKNQDLDPYQLKEEVQMINQHLKNTIQGTRQLARGIYPMGLEAVNLLDVINNLVQDMQARYGVQIEFTHSPDFVCEDNEAASHLYGIIMEAVRNAVRHGKAKHIVIDLLKNQGEISLSVRDNGTGIDEATRTASRGIGLKIMNHRVRMLKGFLEITSNAGGGATLICSIPLKTSGPTMVPLIPNPEIGRA